MENNHHTTSQNPGKVAHQEHAADEGEKKELNSIQGPRHETQPRPGNYTSRKAANQDSRGQDHGKQPMRAGAKRTKQGHEENQQQQRAEAELIPGQFGRGHVPEYNPSQQARECRLALRHENSFTGQANWQGSKDLGKVRSFAKKTRSPARQAGRGRNARRRFSRNSARANWIFFLFLRTSRVEGPSERYWRAFCRPAIHDENFCPILFIILNSCGWCRRIMPEYVRWFFANSILRRVGERASRRRGGESRLRRSTLCAP